MNRDQATEELKARISESTTLPSRGEDANFQEWRAKSHSTLVGALGDSHRIVAQFGGFRYHSQVSGFGNFDAAAYFRQRLAEATGLLKAALYEVEHLTAPAEIFNEAAIDAELWEHVGHLIEGEKWGQAASQSVIFLESKLREWGELDPNVVKGGEAVANAIFKEDGGKFVLGKTSSERQGWYRFAAGIMGAVGNVERHRIEQRDDAKPYAIGVVGAVSLLLTQLRREHANRFATSPG